RAPIAAGKSPHGWMRTPDRHANISAGATTVARPVEVVPSGGIFLRPGRRQDESVTHLPLPRPADCDMCNDQRLAWRCGLRARSSARCTTAWQSDVAVTATLGQAAAITMVGASPARAQI